MSPSKPYDTDPMGATALARTTDRKGALSAPVDPIDERRAKTDAIVAQLKTDKALMAHLADVRESHEKNRIVVPPSLLEEERERAEKRDRLNRRAKPEHETAPSEERVGEENVVEENVVLLEPARAATDTTVRGPAVRVGATTALEAAREPNRRARWAIVGLVVAAAAGALVYVLQGPQAQTPAVSSSSVAAPPSKPTASVLASTSPSQESTSMLPAPAASTATPPQTSAPALPSSSVLATASATHQPTRPPAPAKTEDPPFQMPDP